MRIPLDDLSWQRFAGVALVCLVLSTQVLFQPGLLDYWSLEQVGRGWFDYFAETLLCGTGMWIGVALVGPLREAGRNLHAAAVVGALIIGSFIGSLAAVYLLQPAGFYPPLSTLAGEALRWTIFGVVVYFTHAQLRNATRAGAAVEEASGERANLDRQILEAQLQVLQAQIEPHFLFNTLAHVKHLYGVRPGTGGEMMTSLRHYLNAALPQMRESGSTLGREADLVRAYLNVLQIRLGRRLAFTFDIPEGLLAHPLPPMILVTLVENAIKHGINPRQEGGAIIVRAGIDDGFLEVAVADTGAGFHGSSGSGVGLANIRARLKCLHGERASLSLAPNSPSGVVACIRIPSERAPAREAAA